MSENNKMKAINYSLHFFHKTGSERKNRTELFLCPFQEVGDRGDNDKFVASFVSRGG